MPAPAPLAAADCPLLVRYGGADAAALLSRYDATLAAATASGLPAAAMEEVYRPLTQARDLLARREFVVGFIGISQAGKSTTVNNVLNEEVCATGKMDATSSLPVRVVRAVGRSVDLTYLTDDQWAVRRQKLCVALNRGSPPDDTELRRQLADPTNFRGPDGLPPRVLDDVKYLREFLEARAQYAARLTAAGRVVIGIPFERRYDYTTHGGKAGGDAPLLREARFHLDNPLVANELELCDLPGLDSKRTIDDEVTWEYLPTLHGMFLFANVGTGLLAEGTLKILARITREFGEHFGGRAWVLFNKMDTLSSSAYAGSETVFDTIQRFLDRVGVPADRAVLCSNEVWELAKDASGGTADPARAAERLKQTAAAPVPAACPPALRGAWADLLKDGGVSRVRRLIVEQVAGRLAGEIRDDAGRKLAAAEGNLAAAAAAAKRRAAMSSDDLLAANNCHQAVQRVRHALTAAPAGFAVFDHEDQRMREELGRVIQPGTAELFDSFAPDERRQQFRTHADILDRVCTASIDAGLVERAYAAVGEELKGLPPVALGPDRVDCAGAWVGYAHADRADPSWLDARPGFAGPDMAARLGSADDPLSGAQYQQLMIDKIEAVVRRSVHLVRRRVRLRLSELAVDLARLTGQSDAA